MSPTPCKHLILIGSRSPEGMERRRIWVTEKSAKPVLACSVECASPGLRVTQGTEVSVCANKVISSSILWPRTSLGVTRQSLTSRNCGAGSKRRVWWKCPKGPDHEWSTTLTNRASKDYNFKPTAWRQLALASDDPTKNGNSQHVAPIGNKVGGNVLKTPRMNGRQKFLRG